MAEKKPIDQSMIARAAGAVKEALYSTGWFGPSQPLDVMVPASLEDGVTGRQFDYQTGYNRITTPRSTEAVSFAQLRGLADTCDVLRVVIETRKDQMAKLRWHITPKDPNAEPDERCKQLEDFFQFPDQEHDWDTWLRMLLEDLFVIDAPTVYVHKTLGGGVYSLDPVAGDTIKRVIDMQGRTPPPPNVAYQQVLKGVIAADYTTDELIYRPRNVRTNKIYGYSPVEQIIMTVNIALRRAVHKLQYYTEGNIPEAIVGTPENWNPDQIKHFQDLWDSLNEGNTAERRHMKFVPGKLDMQLMKEEVLKDAFDEWLARVVCFAFSIEPTAFVHQSNRATAESAREAALSEGLAPIMQWVINLINYIISRHFKYDDLKFDWADEKVQDPTQRAAVHKIYLDAGVILPDEVRSDLGLEDLTEAQLASIAAAKAPPPMAIVPSLEVNGQTPAGAAAPPEPGTKPAPPKPGEKVPAAKEGISKAKKAKPGPINRDRASIVKIEKTIAKFWSKYLAAKASKIAAQAAAEIGKSDESRRKAKEILDDLDINFDDSVNEMTALLTVAATDGAEAAFDEIGRDVQDVPTIADWAGDRAAEMVGKKWVDGGLVDNPDAKWVITDSTRDMLQGIISSSIDEGVTMDELADNIADSFGFSDERAAMIARTETAMADSAGQVEAYKSSGVVSGVEWTTSQDDLVSEECNANADAGVIALGELFPSGDEAPPAHPNCRCAVVAVLSEEDQGDE